MIKHSMKLTACVSILGATFLANDAMALNQIQCRELPGNMYLAAIERGDCDINIQTAAGPDEELVVEKPKTNRDGRGGRGGEGNPTGGDGNPGGGSSRSGPAHR